MLASFNLVSPIDVWKEFQGEKLVEDDRGDEAACQSEEEGE
jgi:hypothetical protein